jgi:SpoVK/Ycf46/Vps4 family AAA+-type ATPase
MKLKNFPHHPIDIKGQAQRLKGMSHADVERICLDAIKSSILTDKPELDVQTFEEAVRQQKARISITSKAKLHADD